MGERFKPKRGRREKKGMKQMEKSECRGVRERDKERKREQKKKMRIRGKIGQKDRESPLQSDREKSLVLQQ